jgi:CheY-like chemotaxis protein
VTMRVLVVDDQEDVRALLAVALTGEGLQVSLAASGPEALRAIAAGLRPHLVLLDIQMPDMDGWEVLDRIRGVGDDVPIVLCTVKASLADRQRAWEAGCDGYVIKPFAIERLLREMRVVVGRQLSERIQIRAAALDVLHSLAAPLHQEAGA